MPSSANLKPRTMAHSPPDRPQGQPQKHAAGASLPLEPSVDSGSNPILGSGCQSFVFDRPSRVTHLLEDGDGSSGGNGDGDGQLLSESAAKLGPFPESAPPPPPPNKAQPHRVRGGEVDLAGGEFSRTAGGENGGEMANGLNCSGDGSAAEDAVVRAPAAVGEGIFEAEDAQTAQPAGPGSGVGPGSTAGPGSTSSVVSTSAPSKLPPPATAMHAAASPTVSSSPQDSAAEREDEREMGMTVR